MHAGTPADADLELGAAAAKLALTVETTPPAPPASKAAAAAAAVARALAPLARRRVALAVVALVAFVLCPLLGELSSAFAPLAWRAWFTLGVVILLVSSLTLNLLPTHVAFAYALGVLVLFKCVDEKGALQGFANKGANTVAILYIVAFSVTRTNGMSAVFRLLLGDKPLSLPMVLLRLCLPLGGLSMFLNNTPIYQAALPEVLRYAHAHNIAPSKLLIPVAFAIIFGGTMSLIGTSTNLVVSGLAEADTKLFADGARMSFNIFGLTKIGALYFGVGVTYIITLSARLLPERKKVSVTDNIRAYLVQLEVTPKATTIVGKSIAEAGLRNLQGLFLVDITRGDDTRLVAPDPDTRLCAGDVLTFSGEVDAVKLLFQKDGGLQPVSLDAAGAAHFKSRLANCLYEAVVSPDSVALVGKSVRETAFRSTFGAAIVAISHRSGPVASSKLGDVVLQPGDTLVLEADKRFYSRFAMDNNFALVCTPSRAAARPSTTASTSSSRSSSSPP
jgi:K+/H+ antiporter YhaU regulatory subunit KhtT